MPYFPSLSRQTWPHDPQELDAFYGDPRGLSGANPAWEAANLVTFTFPWRVKSGGQSGRIHKKVKPSLDRVLGAIWDYVGHDQTKIDAAHLSEFGGSYVFRANRNNPAALSNHARGIAIDLAPDENPNRAPWVDDGKHLPRLVIEAFKQEGWRWGGDFSGTKDAMHFEAVFDQHHDQQPVPAPIPPPQGEGGAAPAAPGGGLAASGPALPSILDLGDELAGLLLRKMVLDRTSIPAEVDRFKAAQLVGLLVARAQIDNAIAALQGFTLTPTAPAMAPGAHELLPPPDLAGLLPHAPAPATHAAAPAPAPAGPVQRAIIATVFGGASDRNESAYDGHVITDEEEGCALPFHFAGARPLIAITGPKGSATVPIVDVGPIYPSKRGGADPYWQTGARPRAETDRVLSQAGIDLTPKTARAVGIDGKGKVDWSFATGNEAMSATGETQMPLDQMNSPPNVPSFLVNWKTSAAGAIPILLACVDILQMVSSGHFDQTHLYADLGAFAAGFGLVGAEDAKK